MVLDGFIFAFNIRIRPESFPNEYMRTYTSKSLTKTRTLELFRFLINFGTLSVSDIIKLTNLLISLRYRGLLMFFSFLLFLVSTFDRKNLKLLLLLHCG